MVPLQRKLHNTDKGFEISVYEADLSDPQVFADLRDYLIQKVRKIKAHTAIDTTLPALLNVPTLSADFIKSLQQKTIDITTPATNSIAWFDVRRSRVTEFMAQMLLEGKYQGVFYEQADKRINLSPIQIDKHTSGIDVTGIMDGSSALKFIACEVKASREQGIPCSSSESVISDIKKAYSNEGKRLSREILEYLKNLSAANDVDVNQIQSTISFLCSLLEAESSNDVLLQSVVFIPFLIRSNEKIIGESNIDDFVDLKTEDMPNAQLTGIIWSFNQDIDTFCSQLYDEALNHAN